MPEPRDRCGVRYPPTRRDGKAPHQLAAFDHSAGAALGQVAVDAKRDEIPAIRTLLGYLDLDGAVVTLDAMHTQADTATAITGAGRDCVFTVKAPRRGSPSPASESTAPNPSPTHIHAGRARNQGLI